MLKDYSFLQDELAIDEIRKHQWIESEKAGYDIGFKQAAQDWLDNYAKEWMSYHISETKKSKSPRKSKAKKKLFASRKRDAKAYL